MASGGGKYSMYLVLLPKKKLNMTLESILYTVNFVVPNAA